jgi:hypothetical protein
VCSEGELLLRLRARGGFLVNSSYVVHHLG